MSSHGHVRVTSNDPADRTSSNPTGSVTVTMYIVGLLPAMFMMLQYDDDAIK